MLKPRLVLTFAILAAATLFLRGQTDITGFWVFKMPNGDGTFREAFLDLKVNGAMVTGNVIQGQRQVPIAEGTFRDNHLHFVTVVHFNNREFRTTYDGTLDHDTITLTAERAGRPPLQGTAERSSRAAAAPPARLPLPELHDVPDNGLARTPPMGWNSWNKFAGKVDDAAVRGMADAMVSSGMSKFGYLYVNIDDTWEGQRDAKGNITSNRKFPDMKALADYVHSKGLKIGLYSGPGPKTCAGYEGSYGHEQQDADQWAAWGFDYVKYDWCSAGEIYKDSDMRAVYQKMGDALAKTHRPIVFSLCQYGLDQVWTWGARVGGNSWRTTGDIEDKWSSMSKIGFHQFDIAPYIRPGHWNDPDMLEIGNGGMNADEYRTHMSLWSMLAAPLLAGNDLRTMSDETKSILMNADVIAIDQDPAGKPAKKAAETETTTTVTRELADGSTAVGLFNRGDQPADMSITWASLPGSHTKARDLWQHKDVEVSGDHYSASVPAHGVVLLRVQ